MGKSKAHRRVGAYKTRSDIPYAQRLQMQLQQDININREHAAKITMFCMSISLNKLYGIGYKRLIRFANIFKRINDEFYADVDLGAAHAKHRLNQLGMPISKALDMPNRKGRKEQIIDNRANAVQIALVCGTIAMNDAFGFGKEKLTKVLEKVSDLNVRYSSEGETFLLEEMQRIGFIIVGTSAICCTDENDNPVTAKRAIEEGYLDAYLKAEVL